MDSSKETAQQPSQGPLPSPGTLNGLNKEASDGDAVSNTENQVSEGPVENEMDPKKLRRTLASRQYSQKYRLKQLQYIIQLETEVKALQAEVAITAPRIKYAERQNTLLRVENSAIKQKLSAYSGELMFKQAQYEELKKEKDVLKNIYLQLHQERRPEFFKTNQSGNYQFPNTKLNQPRMN